MKPIKDIIDYLNIVLKLGEDYPQPGSTNNMFGNFLFRGQPDFTFSLKPKLFRWNKDDIEFYQKSSYSPEDIFEKHKTNSEISEPKIIKDFKREAMPYVESSLLFNDLTCIELAQHYGAPTRLLDWTSNPLIALYFACISNAKDENANGAVWILNTSNYAHYSYKDNDYSKENLSVVVQSLIEHDDNILKRPNRPLLLVPFFFDKRMSSQASYFMMWGKCENKLEDQIDNENYMKVNNEKDSHLMKNKEKHMNEFLFKIPIDSRSKELLLYKLDILGINQSSLFPCLDGVGKSLENKYSCDIYATNIRDYDEPIQSKLLGEINGKS